MVLQSVELLTDRLKVDDRTKYHKTPETSIDEMKEEIESMRQPR